MNAISIVGYILSGIIMSFTCHYIWKKLLDIKYKNYKFKVVLSFLILALSAFLNYKFITNYFKVIIIIFAVAMIIRTFYSKNFRVAIVTSLVTEAIFIVSELIFLIFMLVCFNDNMMFITENFFGTLLTNVCVCSIVLLLSQFSIVKKIFERIVTAVERIKMSTILIFCVVLIVSINICLASPYSNINTVSMVIMNTVLIIIYSMIVINFIQEKNRYLDISDKYSLSENSLKELQSNVNRLMAINHENKNQLVTIRGMVANKDKDENILDCLDIMIDKKIKDDQDLKVRTSVISNTMLGSLIYSKLLTMKEKNIKYNLLISKDINKSHIINIGTNLNVDICKIIGVYLDNAIEATSNIAVKEINVEFYLKRGNLYIVISNTFDGNIDMSSINDYGYTTKEEGHGFGLALVREIVKDSAILDTETEIIDNMVFIQRLKIKM